MGSGLNGAMADTMQPLLFEATSRPRQSLGSAGMKVTAALLALGFVLSGTLFLVLGAWPVLGFAGAELFLVFGLFAMHRARSGRCVERVSLDASRLRVHRIDGTGRAHEASIDPYWAWVRLEESDGRLLVGQRRMATEIGLFLNADEKRDLAEALGRALRRFREPRFDNPQLR